MPPEDDPRDEQPIDREEWEAAMGENQERGIPMTPKNSDKCPCGCNYPDHWKQRVEPVAEPQSSDLPGDKCKHGIFTSECDECDGPTFEGNDGLASSPSIDAPQTFQNDEVSQMRNCPKHGGINQYCSICLAELAEKVVIEARAELAKREKYDGAGETLNGDLLGIIEKLMGSEDEREVKLLTSLAAICERYEKVRYPMKPVSPSASVQSASSPSIDAPILGWVDSYPSLTVRTVTKPIDVAPTVRYSCPVCGVWTGSLEEYWTHKHGERVEIVFGVHDRGAFLIATGASSEKEK